jgi:hypothetical protein
VHAIQALTELVGEMVFDVDLGSAWKRPIARVMVLAFGLLVLSGVGLAGAMDAGIVDVTPVLAWLMHLPLALRVIVYVVVGVPVGLGTALYVVLEIADLVGLLASPFEWLGRREADHSLPSDVRDRRGRVRRRGGQVGRVVR